MTSTTSLPRPESLKAPAGAGVSAAFFGHMRKYPSLWVGGLILACFLLLMLFAPQIAPYDPLAQDMPNRLAPPSAEHPFGTDELGRDNFSRVVYGAQLSLPMSLAVVVVALLIGSLLGAAAGFFGGMIDDAIMRLADVTLAFPAVVLSLAIAAILGPSLINAAIAATIVIWPEYARLMRAQVIVLRNQEYVVAARSIGAREGSILLRHVLPGSWTPLIIKAALDVGGVLLLLSALSFLGMGVRPPTPEWGAMIALGRTKFYQWWLATFPGLAILLVILACNLIGEGLRNWLDPHY